MRLIVHFDTSNLLALLNSNLTVGKVEKHKICNLGKIHGSIKHLKMYNIVTHTSCYLTLGQLHQRATVKLNRNEACIKFTTLQHTAGSLGSSTPQWQVEKEWDSSLLESPHILWFFSSVASTVSILKLMMQSK